MTAPQASPKPVRRLIVVADSNARRAKQTVDACTALGTKCVRAPHGAAALELALSSPPDLVIAELDLPLVDGQKLAEILRANPRTRAARFVFLGGTDETSRRVDAADTVLSAIAPVDEVAQVVGALLEKRQRIDALEAAAVNGSRIDGDLVRLPLPDLLQVVNLGRKSGRIDLERERDEMSLEVEAGGARDLERGLVLVRDGEILQAEAGEVDGEKALFRMLTWRNGRFTFELGPRAEAPKILAPARALLNEGMRQLAEWDRLSMQLPSLDAEVRLCVKSADLPNIVHPLTQEVLVLLEHYPVVREIVDRCSFPDYQVLRTLHTLIDRGIVELGQTRTTGLAPAQSREQIFDESQLRRLRDTLDKLTPRGAPTVAGKILVVASESSTLPDLLNLMRGAPGVRLAPELDSQPIGPDSIKTLATLTLEPGLEIDLIQLPTAGFCRPLWPIAGHGALGVMFLLTGPVGQAAERVHEISASLQELPRSRVLHVVLLGRKERVSPEELRENLSLIDESSLFLLPLESGKPPTSLLRSLFSRVVP